MSDNLFTKEENDYIRKDFPLLNNREIIYMDNAATTQKPVQVMDSWRRYYDEYNANPFRGVYGLSVDATECYEDSRSAVAGFIGAGSSSEIVFTRNASESINLLASSLCDMIIKPGDEIIVSIAEHHSNFLPWQQAAKRLGAKIVFFECEEDGEFKAGKLKELINDKTKLLAITHLSNVLGRINDIKTFADICHEKDVIISVDGAQSVPHIPVDVKALDVDFLQFSGHKMLAPMGIGVLYGKGNLLEKMPPYMYGGEMIETVTRDGATYAEVPHKFEAGTVNVGGAYALAEAIRYYEKTGFEKIMARERALTKAAMERIDAIEGISVIGSQNAEDHEGIITFLVDGVHPHDVAAIMDAEGVCVRAGHHCAQPLLQYLYDIREKKNTGGISTTRISLAFYNTLEEVDRMAEALAKIRPEMGIV